MKNVKKNYILYAFLLIYLIIGKFFLEPNYYNIYVYWYNPTVWGILFLILYYFNKDNIKHNSKRKNLYETIIIIMMIYMIIYFISGLFFDYVYSPYDHSLLGIIKNIWGYIFVIVFQEYIRNYLLKEHRGKLWYIVIMLIFIAIELNYKTLNNNLVSAEAIFKYCSSIIIPVICHNVLANYLVFKSDYKSSIVYLVSLKLLTILLPIYPNLDWFISSLYEIILGIILYAVTTDFYEKKVLRKRDKRNNRSYMVTYIPYLILIVFVVFFMGGFFKYRPVAIISNSMYPHIKRGDVVISEKITEKDLKTIKLDDIIEYKLGGASVVHRVVAIDLDKKGNLVFITKGDNNSNIDDEKVNGNQIVGRILLKVPYIGYPTIWVSEIFENNQKPDVDLGN